MRSFVSSPVVLGIGIALTTVTLSATALAADADVESPPEQPSAARSAQNGAFLPLTMSARSDPQRALVFGQGGYNAAEKSGVFETVAEAQILGRLSLRAGGAYFGQSFRPEAGLRVDALRQERHGVDLAVLGFYETKGFNTVKAITARVAVSRAFGDTRLVSNVGYGFGLDEGERYGDFRLAGLHRLTEKLHVGVDPRLRIDLERDADEPAGEPDWEIIAGPVATYAIDRYIVSATAGYSALKYRLVPGTNSGAIGTVGVGAVF